MVGYRHHRIAVLKLVCSQRNRIERQRVAAGLGQGFFDQHPQYSDLELVEYHAAILRIPRSASSLLDAVAGSATIRGS